MRKIIAITQVTLDGVMQAPGGAEEDRRNGFTHGGWAMPFLDDGLNQLVLGEGKRLFENGVPPRGLTLVETRSTPRGVLVNTYHPVGPLPRG